MANTPIFKNLEEGLAEQGFNLIGGTDKTYTFEEAGESISAIRRGYIAEGKTIRDIYFEAVAPSNNEGAAEYRVYVRVENCNPLR